MATQEISNDQIADGTIGPSDLADNCITAAKIASGVVDTVHLAANAVTTSILNAAAVTSAKMAANSVLTASIGDGQVTSIKIVDGAIFASKLATDSVVATKILDGAVVAGKLGTNAVVEANIASNAVTTAKIADANITNAKLVDATITGAKIATATITTSHLSTGELHFRDDTTVLVNRKVILNVEKINVNLTAAFSTDISLAMAGDTAVTSAGSSEGVITDASKNIVALRTSDKQLIVDGSSREIFGRITHSSGVWTLSYYVNSPTETAISMPAPVTNARLLVPRRYNLNVAPEELFRGTDLFSNNVTGLTDHITQASGAHAASAISVLDSGSQFTTDTVQAALLAIVGAGWVQGTADSLQGHMTKTTAAHAATAISFAPDSGKTTPLASAQVRAAIEELHAEVEAMQAAPASAVFGFKSFISSSGQSDFSISGSLNAPFTVGNDSLMVFRGGVLQSKQAGHYTEDPSGMSIHMTTPTNANTNVILKWHKAA